MFNTGKTIRSAKMKAITPPKLIPPFHRIAAKGTLPMEHTNESTATSGPTRGPQIAARVGLPSRKKACQKERGTKAPRAPAIRRPPTMSLHRAPQAPIRLPPRGVKDPLTEEGPEQQRQQNDHDGTSHELPKGELPA